MPEVFRGGGHQGFEAALGKRRNLTAVGIAVVGQVRSEAGPVPAVDRRRCSLAAHPGRWRGG